MFYIILLNKKEIYSYLEFETLPNNLHLESNSIKLIFHLSMIYHFLMHITLLMFHCSLHAP